MPNRSIISQLPPDVREWLEGELLQRGFSGYIELTERLNERLQALGLEVTVSRTSVYRYGASFEERCAALKRTTEMARTITRDLGDDEGATNDALIRLAQDKLFTMLLDSELNEKALGSIAKAVAELGRASVAQKKWMAAMREKLAAAAESVVTAAKQGGLSEEAAEAIRARILGIGSEAGGAP